ncbi:RDD family protein [Arenimonas sp.]|uniref:RDD family protein n=1 Tax=Arenimonas sp. TaxID=1872635 RepID=UPI0039E46FF0
MNPPYRGSPAGFWKRYVAYFIDVMLVSFVVQILTTPVVLVLGFSDPKKIEAMVEQAVKPALASDDALGAMLLLGQWLGGLMLISTLAYALVAGAYFVYCEASPHQATLGKRLIGIKVTDAQGARPTRAQVLGRFFAAALSWATLNLGHALAAWTPERRAMHDYVAGTRVENVDPAQARMPLWGWVIVGANVALFLFFALICALIAAAFLMDAFY